jgi:hypothetical protein
MNAKSQAPEPLQGELKNAVEAVRKSSPPAGFGVNLLTEAASWKHPVAAPKLPSSDQRQLWIGLISTAIAASIFFLWLTADPKKRQVEVATGPQVQAKLEEEFSKRRFTVPNEGELLAESKKKQAESMFRMDPAPDFDVPSDGEETKRNKALPAEGNARFLEQSVIESKKEAAKDSLDITDRVRARIETEATQKKDFADREQLALSKSAAGDFKQNLSDDMKSMPARGSSPLDGADKSPVDKLNHKEVADLPANAPAQPKATDSKATEPKSAELKSAAGLSARGGRSAGFGGARSSAPGDQAEKRTDDATPKMEANDKLREPEARDPRFSNEGKTPAPSRGFTRSAKAGEGEVPADADGDKASETKSATMLGAQVQAGAPGAQPALGSLEKVLAIEPEEKKESVNGLRFGGAAPKRHVAIAGKATKLITTGGKDSGALGRQEHFANNNLLHLFDWSKGDKSTVLSELGPGAFAVDPAGKSVINSNGVLYDLESKTFDRLAALGDNIRALSVSPNGKQLVTQHVAENYACFFRVTEIPAGEPKFDLSNQWGYTFAAGFSPDSASIALMNKDKVINEFSLKDGELQKTYAPPHINSIRAIEYSPNGELLASTGTRGETYLWNRNTAKLIHELKIEQTPEVFAKNGLSAIRFSPNSRFLAASGTSNLFFWDLATGKVAASLNPGSGGAIHLRYSEDGNKITAVKDFVGVQLDSGDTGLKYPTVETFEVPEGAK